MNILDYFSSARAQGLQPALLEFSHHQKRTPIAICGIRPSEMLKVRDGVLWKNGHAMGLALDLFEHLKHSSSSSSFFPAYIGFFAYEFARYFGKDVYLRSPSSSSNQPLSSPADKPRDDDGNENADDQKKLSFPDALFFRYDQGLVIDDGEVIHHDLIDISPPSRARRCDSERSAPSPESQRFAREGENYPAKRNWWLRTSHDEFLSSVRAIKERIRRGDVYQVNYSVPFSFDVDDDDMIALYQAMRTNNNSPYMGILAHDDMWILSGSPERLFSYHDGVITARPIAGTKRRGATRELDDENAHELSTCMKENAEHVMLVDLIRNDINQVAETNSVHVDEDRSVEFYSHVMHLVSEVSGTTHCSLKEMVKALFPGGTITGAPKSSVMSTIAELESSPRGPYTGSLGYISSGYGVDLNILIRSIYRLGNNATINTGAGIVIDSDEEREWFELHNKAQSVIDILDGTRTSTAEPRETLRRYVRDENNLIEEINDADENIRTSSLTHLSPLRARSQGREMGVATVSRRNQRVLFVENNDSFSYNIVACVQALATDVEVLMAKTKSDDAVLSNLDDITHVILGPGPGNPCEMPHLSRIIDEVVKHKLPLLGICLGHQAIGHHFGGTIARLPLPIHGKEYAIRHFDRGLFAGMPSPTRFVRYHSLAIIQAPTQFVVDAYSDDDCIMAIRHEQLPIFGLQFHPESYLSENGHRLLARFLS